MRVGLVDVDGHNFPNLALMKLSAWHKAHGDSVEFADPMFGAYDVVYMSKVFTFSPDNQCHFNAKKIIKAGTGYGDYSTALLDEIEHTCPDYTLYPLNKHYDGKTAYGFLTRGCIRKCQWCIVPHKEGGIKAHADIDEFIGPHNKAILLDNNVLASQWGLQQIEKMNHKKIKVDFNQGLDARIIANDRNIAKLLSETSWIKYIRMAYDSSRVRNAVLTAIENLLSFGMRPQKMFFYLLVTDDLHDANRRASDLDYVGAIPFAQPYRDFEKNAEPSQAQKDFARWVNHRATFRSCTFSDYSPRKNFKCNEYLKQLTL